MSIDVEKTVRDNLDKMVHMSLVVLILLLGKSTSWSGRQ
jgi:hypothetical protein